MSGVVTDETSLNEGLIALVAADPGVTAAAGAAQTMYPGELPPNVTLGIVFLAVAGSSTPTFCDRGMDKLRYQFDCYAASAKQGTAMRVALRNLLEGFTGALPNGMLVAGCDWIGPMGRFENELRTNRRSGEFYLYVNFD
jgi:hypothetical protein